MKLSTTLFLNRRKLAKRTRRALFLIIPIGFLVFLSLAVSSSVVNVRNAVEESVFGTVEEQYSLLRVSNFEQQTNEGPSRGPGAFSTFFGGQDFTEADLAVVQDIPHIVTADFATEVPLQNTIETTTLVPGHTVAIQAVSTLDESIAPLYTDQSFTYTEGDAIPILLNAQSFIETTENWNGQDEIVISFDAGDLPKPGEAGAIRQRLSTGPIATTAIDVDTASLIGREFTLRIGGLAAIPTFTVEPSSSGMIFAKTSQEDIDAAIADRRTSLEPYWDVDALSEPAEYRFVVAGIIEDENDQSTYIPEEAAAAIVADQIETQLAARTDTDLPLSLLDSTFTGLTYDGTELQGSSSFGGMIRRATAGFAPREGFGIAVSGDVAADQSVQESIEVPGLVIEIARAEESDTGGPSANEVLSAWTDPNVYDDATRLSGTMLVKVDSVFNRSQVVDDLNAAGFTYQDTSGVDVLDELRSTLQWISRIMIVSFIGLSILIIVFTMTKFVSEATREIGIYRALGVTQHGIRQLFAMQGVLYTALGYVAGVVIGSIAMQVVAGPLHAWFSTFLEKTVVETYSVSNTVDVSLFRAIDWPTFGLYSGLLLVITVITSMIPANHAARIDPVDAIRNE